MKIRGEIWACGDDWCDCTEAQIVSYEPNGRYWKPTVLWAGEFHTDSEWTATRHELIRVAWAMHRYWHDAYKQIVWPWANRGDR